QEEGRTPADFALGPYPAAHSRDGLSHQGEPDAGARIVLGTMQALENVEDAVMVLHVESDAVVTHPQQNPAVTRARTDLDARRGARAAELDGVLEQIAQRQREAVAIDTRGQVGAHIVNDLDLGGRIVADRGRLA